MPAASSSIRSPSGFGGRTLQSIEGAGAAVQRALEGNALSRAIGSSLVQVAAPPIDRLGRRADAALRGLGARVEELAQGLQAGADHHRLGALRRGLARSLEKIAGSDTLRRTALTVGGGVRFKVPWVINTGVWASQFMPSLELAEKKGGYSKALYTNYGADVQSLVGGMGWGRRGRAAAGVNLFFVSASYDQKQTVVFMGLPGRFGVTLGSDVERGSYLSLSGSLGLIPGALVGPIATGSVDLYTPLLDPITQHVARPVASALSNLVKKLAAGAQGLAEDARQLAARPLPAIP